MNIEKLMRHHRSSFVCFAKMRLLLLMVFLTIGIRSYGQLGDRKIEGVVINTKTQIPIPRVEVKLVEGISNSPVMRTITDAKGQFVFHISKAIGTHDSLFALMAQYGSCESERQLVFNIFRSSDYKIIRLYCPDTISKPVKLLEKNAFVSKKLMARKIIPTQGAVNMFYSLNPGLEGMSRVPENYHVVFPKMPSLKPYRKRFRRLFREHKKSGEPFIAMIEKWFGFEGPVGTLIGNDGWIGGIQPNLELPPVNGPDGPKKFAFVVAKRDANNILVPVENSYTVHYYSGNGLPNIADGATLGYATMYAGEYNIDVYAKGDGGDPTQKIRILDFHIDTTDRYRKAKSLPDLLNKIGTWFIVIELLD